MREAGKTDLAEFIFAKSPKALHDLISSIWEMNEALARIERNQKSRMEVLEEILRQQRYYDCQGEWLRCAREVLKNKKLMPMLCWHSL